MAWQLVQYNSAFDALSEEMKKALKPRLAKLLLFGNRTKYPITEALGEGLFQLRARDKKVRVRLLYGYLPGKRIVVVLGCTKDQPRLPRKTLETARRLLDEAKAQEEALDVINFH